MTTISEPPPALAGLKALGVAAKVMAVLLEMVPREFANRATGREAFTVAELIVLALYLELVLESTANGWTGGLGARGGGGARRPCSPGGPVSRGAAGGQRRRGRGRPGSGMARLGDGRTSASVIGAALDLLVSGLKETEQST